MSLNIPVILGSVRPGRNSFFPAKLMVEKLLAAGHASQLVDFKELPLPFLDSAEEPSDLDKKYPHENVQKWSAIADAADAFVLVVPEYNHSYPGVLKNALDWLFPEFKRKVVGLVGVSNGAIGGARAIVQLRDVLATLNLFTIRETVMFAKAQNMFDTSGKLLDDSVNKKIDGFIAALSFAGEALKRARESAK